jgi:quercetin 2,3-dioxygenase
MNWTRRRIIKTAACASITGVAACEERVHSSGRVISRDSVIRDLTPLPSGTRPWPTEDPFLFCVYHKDNYPRGNSQLGPAASLAGRNIGQDFAGLDGWRMYHGDTVPGFPMHPHRGFETITVVRKGYLDHADSLGAAARYGNGDVQWLTAGAGIQHSEMFPLLKNDEYNPTDFFQIWLNLPGSKKFAKPHFSMFWEPRIPRFTLTDRQGNRSHVRVVAGAFYDRVPPSPPPDSWASQPDTDLAIWNIKLEPQASLSLPTARAGTNRAIYFFKGEKLSIHGHAVPKRNRIAVHPEVSLEIRNGDQLSEVLVLQGRPILEPVVKHGPFVMNTREEIETAIADYRATQFGGWPWPARDPIHGSRIHRFARYADGSTELPG